MADKPEIDRIVPAHAALVFVLRHIAIQQPEVKAEAQKHIDNLDEQFRQLLQSPPAAPAKTKPGRASAAEKSAAGEAHERAGAEEIPQGDQQN